MKKAVILGILAVLIGLLPLVGNKVVKNSIEQRLEQLSQNGLQVKLIQEERGYLKTKLHYTVRVDDERKFLEYLQTFSSRELPPYTKSLLDSVVFAADIRYSNIPFNEKISIDLYPRKLSRGVMEDIQKRAPKTYVFLTKLLQKKALLYHIDYDVTSREFQGYMKDLDERFTTDEDTNVSMVLNGIEASGKGVLLAPDTLRMHINHVALAMENDTGTFHFEVKDLLTTSAFASKTTYHVSSKVASVLLSLHTLRQNPATGAEMTEEMQMELKNFALNASSDTRGKEAEFFAKLSAQKLRLAQNSKSLVLRGLNYEGVLSGIEKESFVKLQQILEENSKKQSVSPQLEQELEALLVKIFAHGMHLKITDFSLKKLSVWNMKEIDGFKISLQADIKSDPAFVKKYKQKSATLIQNLSVESDVRLSKRFYALINRFYPIDLMVADYKKEQGREILFHIKFKNGTATINGKKVQ